MRFQVRDLLLRQRPPLTRRERAEPQLPLCHAHEPPYTQPRERTQAAHLPVAPFMDCDGQPAWREHRHFCRADTLALQLRDGMHSLCRGCEVAALYVHLIRFGDLV